MRTLRRIAQHVRHLPGLEKADWLWTALRKPYQRVIDGGGRGVEVWISGIAPVRMPAEFANCRWEQFEPDAMAVFVEWIRKHPGALILDIGSAIGLYSAVALSVDSQVDLVAFDSCLSSLAAVRRICRDAHGTRLRLVHGFVSEMSRVATTLDSVIANTEDALSKSDVRGDFGTIRFVCLTDEHVHGIPVLRLDDLFTDDMVKQRPLLIKCDVEGAEMLVLRGAETLLRRNHPDLLLSVHPRALPDYGHSPEDIVLLLQDIGYSIRCVGIDYEEHWFCQFKLQVGSATW